MKSCLIFFSLVLGLCPAFAQKPTIVWEMKEAVPVLSKELDGLLVKKLDALVQGEVDLLETQDLLQGPWVQIFSASRLYSQDDEQTPPYLPTGQIVPSSIESLRLFLTFDVRKQSCVVDSASMVADQVSPAGEILSKIRIENTSVVKYTINDDQVIRINSVHKVPVGAPPPADDFLSDYLCGLTNIPEVDSYSPLLLCAAVNSKITMDSSPSFEVFRRTGI